MLKKTWYSEKLRDPRWIKLRSEIIERDGFMCDLCAHGESLQVHHIKYITGLKPWEYDPKYLITLCSWCHASVSGIRLRERKNYSDTPLETRKIHPAMVPLFKKLADRMRFPEVVIEHNYQQEELQHDEQYEECDS